jgi:hypothetical protein
LVIGKKRKYEKAAAEFRNLKLHSDDALDNKIKVSCRLLDFVEIMNVSFKKTDNELA